MDKKLVLDVLKKVKESSNKRNFKQSIDFIVSFKDLDLKKADNQLDLFVVLHHSKGKKIKVCALVGPELLEQAKQACDLAISVDDFQKYDKKKAKGLSKEYDFFIAQANIMPKIASSFGKFLGPKGKMPNPKADCIVASGANLKALYEKLQKTVYVNVKKDPLFQCIVGLEDGNEEEIADNVTDIYNSILAHLPSEKYNINNMYLKLTMGPSVKFGGKEKEIIVKKKISTEEEKPAEKEKKKMTDKKPIKKKEKKENQDQNSIETKSIKEK
jgi:large subunit ribosomal protein L1